MLNCQHHCGHGNHQQVFHEGHVARRQLEHGTQAGTLHLIGRKHVACALCASGLLAVVASWPLTISVVINPGDVEVNAR